MAARPRIPDRARGRAFPGRLRARTRAATSATAATGDPDGQLPPFVTSDDNLTAMVDGTEFHDQKMRALAAHATLITTDGPFFALSNNAGSRAWGYEFYRIAKGTPAAPFDDRGLETDLFNGL